LKVIFFFSLLFGCCCAFAQDAVQLRKQGVWYASKGNYEQAAPLLKQAAELGYYVAQMEYAVLLDSSPLPVNNNVEAYAWYSLVIARKGTDTKFAEERRAIVAKRLSEGEAQAANQSASVLVAKYGQPAK
jgi:hypothetical protein